MAKRIREVTRDFLKAVPLPVQTSSYTVISHESVMNYVFAELANQGFSILSEEYRCTQDGLIAQGIYKLNFNSDEEMSLMFAWSNSYNKQLKFKCVTGGYVAANQTVMLCGEIGSWTRKHTGTADADAISMIQTQIANAQMYYTNLVADKEAMKQIPLTTKRQAELLGVLFAEYELLTTEQASIVRQQIDKPSFFYNGGKHTLWSFYNHVTVAFQQSHPRTWMEDQRMLHWFISNEFDLSGTPVVSPIVQAMIEVTEPMVDPLHAIPNQTNILDQITEIEKETELVQYTDPAGNTFELPMLKESEIPVVETKVPQEFIDALMNAPEIDAREIDMSKVTWVDAPEIVKEVEAAPKLSLDDILIRIPNEEKMKAEVEIKDEELTTAFQRIETKELKETLQKEEQKGKLPTAIQSRLDAFNAKRETESLILTPEEMEEHKEELDQLQAEEYELKHTDDYQDINEQKAEAELEVEAVNATETQQDTFDDFSFNLGSDDEDPKFDDDFL